jgi:hypothetical protein
MSENKRGQEGLKMLNLQTIQSDAEPATGAIPDTIC